MYALNILRSNWIIFLLSVLIFSLSVLSGISFAGKWDAGFQNKSYFYNLEYMGIKYKTGETFFGDHLHVDTRYMPDNALTYTAGVFVAKAYGSETSLSPVEPMLTFLYAPNESFSLTFGNLDIENHKYWQGLRDEDMRYRRPLESGFEFLFSGGMASERLWINWMRLNTPAHRENFDVGSLTEVRFDPITFNIQAHINHWGGQLYDIGPIDENFAIAAGATYSAPAFERLDFSLRGYFAHDVPHRGEDSLTTDGGGGEFDISAVLHGIKANWSYWSGRDFIADNGDPFYMADWFTRLGADKTFKISENVSISFGANAIYIDDRLTHNEQFVVSYRERFALK